MPPNVMCDLASGSDYEIGQRLVTCEATDSSVNGGWGQKNSFYDFLKNATFRVKSGAINRFYG